MGELILLACALGLWKLVDLSVLLNFLYCTLLLAGFEENFAFPGSFGWNPL